MIVSRHRGLYIRGSYLTTRNSSHMIRPYRFQIPPLKVALGEIGETFNLHQTWIPPYIRGDCSMDPSSVCYGYRALVLVLGRCLVPIDFLQIPPAVEIRTGVCWKDCGFQYQERNDLPPYTAQVLHTFTLDRIGCQSDKILSDIKNQGSVIDIKSYMYEWS